MDTLLDMGISENKLGTYKSNEDFKIKLKNFLNVSYRKVHLIKRVKTRDRIVSKGFILMTQSFMFFFIHKL